MQNTFYIVYPDEQEVPEATMKMWAYDAYSDGDIPGPLTLPLLDLIDQMEDHGLITLGGDDYDEEGSYFEDDPAFYGYEDLRDAHSPQFADPGGVSALRAETPTNPRNLPCPTCDEPNRLTPKDRQLGYQCDACANRAERGLEY